MTGGRTDEEEVRRPGTQLVGKAGTGRVIPFVAGAVLAAIVLLVLKPWAPEAPSPQASRSPRADASAPAASPTRPASPSGAGGPAIPCISTVQWRVVTVERTAGRESRSWIAVEPRRAGGPRDRAVPLVRVAAGRLLGLGLCAPEGLPAGATEPVDVWRLVGSGANQRAEPIAALRVVAPQAEGGALVYAPPGRAATWVPGRYVFGIGARRAPLFFGVEVVRAASDPGG